MVGALDVPVTPKELQNSADLVMETPSEENTKFVVDFLSLFPPSSEPSSDRKEKD